MSRDRANRALAGAALLLVTLSLGACSTSVADLPLAGTPADAPVRPKDVGAYLPVNDLPPDRDEAAMNPAERAKLQKELITARERQASATANSGANPATANKDPAAK